MVNEMKTLVVSSVEKGLLVFALFSLLLNGVALYKSASLTEHGVLQERLTALASPLKLISEETGLCRLRSGVSGTVGAWLNKKESEELR